MEKSLTESELDPSSFTMKHRFASSLSVEELLDEDTSFSSCTAQVVGVDDVAAINSIGVLNGTHGWQK